MTQLQELEQKIIKYVPEIMELKKGCCCKFKDGGIAMITKVEYGGYFSAVNGGAMKMVSKEQIEEIIGRPITFEDVLMAISKSGAELNDYDLSEDRISFYDEDDFGEYQISWEWLFNVPFENQAKDTIISLNKLIK